VYINDVRTARLFLLLLQLDRGQEAFRRQDWVEAEHAFVEAIRTRPNEAPGYKWLGMTYAAQEKYLQAEPLFRQACRLAATDPDACYYHGRTLYTLSRFTEALEVLGNVHMQTGRVLLARALASEALDKAGEAERFYRQAIAKGDRQALVDFDLFRNKQAPEGVQVPAVEFEPRVLPFTVQNGAVGKKRLIETMIAGVAVFDFDGDGWPDIFLSNGEEPNALLRNNHDGTFTDVAAKAGVTGPRWAMGAAAADYDNDGNTDLFLTAVGRHVLYRNRGDGTFAPVEFPGSSLWSVAAAWVDYDNDGWLDLFEARYVDWNEAKEPRCGTADHRVYCHPRQYKGLPNALYRNLGNGRFEDVSARAAIHKHVGKGMGVAIGDCDNDGRMDVFVANDTVPNFLFRNVGEGRFEEVGLSAGVAYNADGVAVSSMGAEFRDINNDGAEDLFVTAMTNEMFALFENTGKGSFRDVTMRSGIAKASLPWTGWSNVVADFNNDGWKDLFTANGHVMDNAEVTSGRQSRQPNQLYLNRHQSFHASTVGEPALHRGLAVGDFDRDGRLDLVLTRLNEPALVLWNRTQSPANWVEFELRGRRSNRDGIGARVEIETPKGKQWNRAVTSSGYGASSPKLVHFGIGAATKVDSVVIRWPSGAVQRLDNVSLGPHVVEESQGR